MSKRRGVLHYRGREIVCNVTKFFESEKQRASGLLRSLNGYAFKHLTPDSPVLLSQSIFNELCELLKEAAQSTQRITLATGTSNISKIGYDRNADTAGIGQLSAPKNTSRGKVKKIQLFDNYDFCVVSQLINKFYLVDRVVPSMNEIYEKAKTDLNYQASLSTLRRVLENHLGYKFIRCSHNQFKFMQKPSIKASRARYLRCIQENDLSSNKKPIIYLAESWIRSNYTVNKCFRSGEGSENSKNTTYGSKWIVAHAGGVNGFLNGAFLMFKTKPGESYKENFTIWLNRQVIPSLPQNCLVIINSAPYYSAEIDSAPNMSSKKTEMQEWLNKQGVYYQQVFSKAELYELIKQYKPPRNYVVDNLFTNLGHSVLRLPPCCYDLNPMEYIWHIVRKKVADKIKTLPKSEIERVTWEAVESITVDNWRREMEHVKQVEQQYAEIQQLEDNDESPFELDISAGGYKSDAEEPTDGDDDGEDRLSGVED